MDTWMVTRLAVDFGFVIIIAAFVTFFLYRREKRLRALIAQHVLNNLAPAPAMVERPAVAVSEPIETVRATPAPQAPRAQPAPRPALVANYESQRTFAPVTPPRSARKLSRTEKYLEAVRMYRQGSRRDEIERALGISFMELELLGQLK